MAKNVRFARGDFENYDPSGKHSDYLYFATDTHRLMMNGNSYGGSDMVVSQSEPTDTDVIWVDPTGDENINQEGNLDTIRQSISVLQQLMERVLRVVEYGAIAGDSSNGARTLLMALAAPINPNGEDEGDTQLIEPDKLGYTVPNISVKCDELANFQTNKRNLIDGELIWITDKTQLYIYINGKFMPISNGSGGGTIDDDDDMTQSDIEELYFNHLGLTDSNGNNYKMEMNDDGNVIVYNDKNYDGNMGNPGSYGSYISDYLRINSIFLGGKGTKLDSFSACTHNFVELANASLKNINLNGIWLLYQEPGTTEWKGLALHGTIYAGSTFLIRGAQCSCESNVTIGVNSYDMIWKDGNDPIEFNSGGGTFYLVCSEGGKFYTSATATSDLAGLAKLTEWNPYLESSTLQGYIDLVGISTRDTTATVKSENTALNVPAASDPKDIVFIRSFTLDPCKLAQKTWTARKSSALWTYVDFAKTGSDAFPYYTEKMKHAFVPKSSVLHKNIFGTRSVFDENHPNMLNITFGKLATDAGSGATRCFNWVSVGYYNEYIEYKLHDKDWEGATKVYSINKGETYTDSNINTFIDVYTRIKWVTTNGTAVTTHKAIVRGLAAGYYDVRIGRDGVDSYDDTVHHFTVRTDAQVNAGFKFVLTTDQQAFNFYEYQAWAKAAYAISKNDGDLLFTINTGDMTLNGNRENEWIDYYDARKPLADTEDMVTVGNNDLCGRTVYELGNGDAGEYKVNHKNMQYYYCFELDEDNPQIFTFGDGNKIDKSKLGDVLSYTDTTFTYYMPSLYSFNYGKWHFICLNSEFASNTYKCYYNSEALQTTFKPHAFYNMYKWLEKDCSSDKNNIAYMHEIPFCICALKAKGSNEAVKRTDSNGSKLNQDFTAGIACTPEATDKAETYAGNCNFSQFFQEHNVKLCLGGHKHTYSLSYPMKENVTTTGSTRTVDPANPIVDKTGTDGVVYAMCQATGYKLVSNNELPGTNVDWLKVYFPADTGGNSNGSQYYPMYSSYKINGDNINMQSYAVYNIYKEKTTAFNINNQYTAFTTENATKIDGTNITIAY